jgi:hypothetical protein
MWRVWAFRILLVIAILECLAVIWRILNPPATIYYFVPLSQLL